MTMYVSANIGGTWTRVSLAEGNRVIACAKEPTVITGDNTAIPKRIVQLYKILSNEYGHNVNGAEKIGISFAGLIVGNGNSAKGIATNICGGLDGNSEIPNNWLHVDFSSLFDEFADVMIKNDVIAEMLVEHSHGALKGYKHCAYINWGTGVGAGIIIDGCLLKGKQGFADIRQ